MSQPDEVEQVANYGGGFIRRQLGESDDEFSLRVSQERSKRQMESKNREHSAESPLVKFKRLWSHLS